MNTNNTMHFDTFHCLCDDFKCVHNGRAVESSEFGTTVDSIALKNSLMNPMFGSDPLSFAPYHPFYMKAASYHYGKPHHSKEFTDVRQMESTLYKLLTDFRTDLGKLHAFGEGVTFENMIKVREQQENLARLHFELNLQQSNKQSFETDSFFNDSPGQVNSIMSKPFSKSNMLKLIQNLQNLCKSIERLQWKNSNELEFN